jgi:dephospho-CoA kinase
METRDDPRTADNPLPNPREGAPRVLVIGLLGGIASGKSEAARMLAGRTGVVVDADRHARAALALPEVVARVRERFGDEAVGPDGEVRREVLAERVFRDPEDRRALESWTHPIVRERIFAEVREAREAGKTPIVLDVPLLVENDAHHGFARACDVLVFVDADDAERERRARATRGWEPGELARREAAQLPLEEKRELAHHLLSNRTSVVDLEAAVGRLRRELGLD